MMRSGDAGYRRRHLRYEIVGTIAGAVVSTEVLKVVNIGASGALIESDLPLPLNGEYRMQLVVASTVIDAVAKVRRVADRRRSLDGARYSIGVEFLDLSLEAQDAIERTVTLAQPEAELGAG